MRGVVAQGHNRLITVIEGQHFENRIDHAFRRGQSLFDPRGALLVALAFCLRGQSGQNVLGDAIRTGAGDGDPAVRAENPAVGGHLIDLGFTDSQMGDWLSFL